MGPIPRALTGLLCGLLVSCGQSEPDPRIDPRALAHGGPPPETREGFLAELLPLPFDALVIVYDVRGPAGLHGTLEVLARPGGERRHNWRLELPVEGATPVRIEGSAVATPDAVWSDGAEGPVVRARGAGALADAYLAASPRERARVMETLRRWHAELERGRARHPGRTATISGIECLDTRLAGRHLCLWEETGLALRDEGPGLSIEALAIEVDPELGPRAFELPVDTPPATIHGEAALRALAQGDVTVLAKLTRPDSWRPGDPNAEI
jgi:hypothetical protein